jgi:putative membrane protein (TIGR04086 family)
MTKVSVKGVLIGAIVDVIASGIAGIPLVLYVMTQMGITDAPTGQDQQSRVAAVTSLVHADTILHSIQLALGLACSILGGYVAARIAKHDEVLNGALSSFLCILLGIYSAASGKALESPAEHALLFAASFGAAALGGFLARKSGRVAAA